MNIRDEWINRPGHLMYLSLADYIAAKEDKVSPKQPTVQSPVAKPSGRPRHEPGKMNGLEKKYAQHLEMRKMTGEILDWRFEPLKLRLAPATYYTPDFLLLMPDRTIELHETKGTFIEDDSAVKIKVAREMFAGIFTIVLVRLDKNKNWTFK